MNCFFITLFIILLVIFAIYLIHYIRTLPKRHKNKEILKRELSLYEEKCRAEQAKQSARIAGKIALDNINNIANKNNTGI